MTGIKQNKILIIFPFLTHPVDAGNKRWVMSQVEELRALGQDVYMLCLNVPGLKVDRQKNKELVSQTRNWWKDHGFIYEASFALRVRYSLIMNMRRRFFKGYFNCDDLYPRELGSYVRELQATHNFDICIVNYYWLSKVLEDVRFNKTAVNTHDVFAERDKVLGSKTPWMCTSKAEESRAVQRAQYVFALQDQESAYFTSIAPEAEVLNVYCPYTVDKLPVCNNHNLVILAAAGDLNLDGFEWFIEEILPAVVKQFPDIKLVVGGGICQLLQKYSDNPNIELIGRVDHPRDLYKLGDIAINPCRRGTGLKIKTFEAMSFGRICMVHPHSMTGIYNKSQAPVFASDNADEWASYLCELWKSSSLESQMQKSIDYIDEMNEYIESEYKQFLNQ